MLLPTLALAAAVTAVCHVKSPPHTVALVELYTSQGCSSCPPADRWLSSLASFERAVPLALHVGYWDYIGWKDPYARREFNERQSWLARLNSTRTVYTPGVFLQARETRWSDSRGFDAAVAAINQRPAAAQIELGVQTLSGGRLDVRTAAQLNAGAAAKDAALFVALTENGLATDVKAGENRGEHLRNDHVTRDWSGAQPLSTQSVSLQVPDTPRERLAVVAFVQDRSSGQVLQAVRLPLAACNK